MPHRFVTLDVFTDRQFSGNPLAVVLDADKLDTVAMQAVAREFNYPETVFVLSPSKPTYRARLRIFTPARELPFAGHPTVGTAVLLGLMDGGDAAREFVVEEAIGPVRCLVEPIAADCSFARFALPQLPVQVGDAPNDTKIAAALGLPVGVIGCPGMRPAVWSAGLPLAFVPVARRAAVRDCHPDAGKLIEAFGPQPVYLFSPESVERGHDFHARMFAPSLGIPEDPATGAAAAAFAGLLGAHGKLDNGEHAFAIEQGYEMGRPSLIRLALVMSRGKLLSASVGGDAVVVTQGTIAT